MVLAWPDNKVAIDPGKDFDATAELARVGYNVSDARPR